MSQVRSFGGTNSCEVKILDTDRNLDAAAILDFFRKSYK